MKFIVNMMWMKIYQCLNERQSETMSFGSNFWSVHLGVILLVIVASFLIYNDHSVHGQPDLLNVSPQRQTLERYYSLAGPRRSFNGYEQAFGSFWQDYRGTWLRNHFEDWIGVRQDRSSQGKDPSNYPEWFETTSDDKTCTTVPPTVNAGRPPSDICLNAQTDERRCICIKQQGNRRGVYRPVCGQCRDPCALRFIPRSSVEYLQKLTATEAGQDRVAEDNLED